MIKKTSISTIQSSRQIMVADKRESERVLDTAALKCHVEEGETGEPNESKMNCNLY